MDITYNEYLGYRTKRTIEHATRSIKNAFSRVAKSANKALLPNYNFKPIPFAQTLKKANLLNKLDMFGTLFIAAAVVIASPATAHKVVSDCVYSVNAEIKEDTRQADLAIKRANGMKLIKDTPSLHSPSFFV